MFNKLKQSQEMNYDYDENMKYFKKIIRMNRFQQPYS